MIGRVPARPVQKRRAQFAQGALAPRFHALRLAKERQRVHGAADARVFLVNRARVIAMQIAQFLHRRAEDVVVLRPGFLHDLHVGAVVGADGGRAVEHQFHVAGAAGLGAGGGDLLGEVGGGDDLLRHGAVVVLNEHHLHHPARLFVGVDHFRQTVDEVDDGLGARVAGRGLGTEDEGRGREAWQVARLVLAVEVVDGQSVHQLPLVLVQALDLHVEHEVRVKFHAVVLAHEPGKLLLFQPLDGHELVRHVLDVRRQRLERGEVGLETRADAPGDEPGKFRVAQKQPAPLRHAVGDVGEAVGIEFVEAAEHRALEKFGVDLRHAVDRVRGVHGQPRHVRLPVFDDGQAACVHAAPGKFLAERLVDADDDAGDLRRDAAQKFHVPLFQRLLHHRVVGVGKHAPGDLQRLCKAHAALIQQANQFGNGHGRVRVVELHGDGGGQFLQRLAGFVELPEDVLQTGADQHVLLLDAHLLAGAQRVVGVQHLGDVLGAVLHRRSLRVLLLVEEAEVEFFLALRLPQPQRADVAPAQTDDRHVVGYGHHLARAHRHGHGKVVAAHAPGVAPLRPVVRGLHLAAVLKRLAEEAELVAQPVAVQRDVVRGGAVEETGRQTAQTAVAQRHVLHLFEGIEVNALFGKQLAHFLQNAHGQQVVKHHPAHQILRREVEGAAAGGVTALAGRPVGSQLHHAGLRQRLVQLFGRGVAKRAARLLEQYPFRA